jgi:hypothetical protein
VRRNRRHGERPRPGHHAADGEAGSPALELNGERAQIRKGIAAHVDGPGDSEISFEI